MILLLSLVTAALPFSAFASAIYDYVVVGGGATGLSLAVRLSEDPSANVIVLEAGETCGKR